MPGVPTHLLQEPLLELTLGLQFLLQTPGVHFKHGVFLLQVTELDIGEVAMIPHLGMLDAKHLGMIFANSHKPSHIKNNQVLKVRT